ncbi:MULTISPECIES: enoyl-CoA hydratase-related protein [unclassified Iodidimonas]|uniref:enoyl-CoA hydratase-related protein n=1 Tax=unclassified Iodidimonas TaxID=2626145 RepID=UPI0024829B2B|nr:MULTISPECIES: enoyl-CoA hydratase-related protein [unclassified Iodidimonas]
MPDHRPEPFKALNFQTIELTINGSLAIIRLNRPDRLNALSPLLLRELHQAVTSLSAGDSPARCLIITGAGRGFSAGADLLANSAENAVDKAPSPDLSHSLRSFYHPLIMALYDLPIPIIAAVNGPAAGAGMSLALTADFILAARSATFMQAFVQIGLAPDAGSSWALPRLIGPARAARLMMLGEKLSAEDALSWGLVMAVHDDEKLLDEAEKLGHRLAQGPSQSYAAIRALLRASADHDLPTQLELEAETQKKLGQTADFIEGVRAFIEKRPARFSGQ